MDKRWLANLKSLIDVVDCPGGHIMICITVGVFGVFMFFAGTALWGHDEKTSDLLFRVTAPLAAFLPIAAYAMRGTEKANGKSTSSATTTSTVSTVQTGLPPIPPPEPPPVPPIVPSAPDDTDKPSNIGFVR